MSGPRQSYACDMLANAIIVASLEKVSMVDLLDKLYSLHVEREVGGLALTILECLDDRHQALYRAVLDAAEEAA